MNQNYIFTSESVSEGHPDKLCDRISDSILDAYLTKMPEARVAVETLATTNLIVLAGEVRPADLLSEAEIEEIVRGAVKDIGYEQQGFNWQTLEIINRIHAQSVDIAAGVDSSFDKDNMEGAGDQGIMFGYACRETEALMPAPIYYAHKILRELAAFRKSDSQQRLGPDSKSQVALVYENGVPKRVASLVLSTQHIEGLAPEEIRALAMPIMEDVLGGLELCDAADIFINPTGNFVIGGPDGDAGLTGRKIIVDTYGGAAAHGGGAFSGKDPTKVDRSAAYAARYLAKNIVAAGLADKCTLQLSYAIGVAAPLAVYVDFHGTGRVGEAALAAALPRLMDLTPQGIRQHLQLNRPIYARTAAYGHFGRDPEPDGGFAWEKTDLDFSDLNL